MGFIMQHLAPLLTVGVVVAGAATWILKNGAPWVEKQVAALDEELLSEIKSPVLRQLCVDVEAAVVKACPDAGDARYAFLVDRLIDEAPQAAPFRAVLIATLTAIGAGAKAGVEDATKAA